MHTIRFCVALLVAMGFSGVGLAAEPCCEMEMVMGRPAPLSQSDEQAVVRALQGYAEGFIREDVRLLLGLWDERNSEDVSYVPVEMDDPIIGLRNLRPYYQALFGLLDVRSGTVSDVQIFPLTGDLVYAFCHYNWVFVSDAGGPPLQEQTRATFVLRKRGGKWLYEHFHESITH